MDIEVLHFTLSFTANYSGGRVSRFIYMGKPRLFHRGRRRRGAATRYNIMSRGFEEQQIYVNCPLKFFHFFIFQLLLLLLLLLILVARGRLMMVPPLAADIQTGRRPGWVAPFWCSAPNKHSSVMMNSCSMLVRFNYRVKEMVNKFSMSQFNMPCFSTMLVGRAEYFKTGKGRCFRIINLNCGRDLFKCFTWNIKQFYAFLMQLSV